MMNAINMIKVTDSYLEKTVYINANTICDISCSDSDPRTCIDTNYGDKIRSLYVDESVEEILAMINGETITAPAETKKEEPNVEVSNVAEFGLMTYEGNTNIPTLAIKVGETVGYLTPFRAYSFQVSGSKDGDGDYGSSGIIQFRKLNVDKSTMINIMKAAAVDAVAEYCHRFGAVLPSTHYGWTDSTFKHFINSCYEWAVGDNSKLF